MSFALNYISQRIDQVGVINFEGERFGDMPRVKMSPHKPGIYVKSLYKKQGLYIIQLANDEEILLGSASNEMTGTIYQRLKLMELNEKLQSE